MKKLILIMLGFFGLAVASCSRDDAGSSGINPVKGEKVTVKYTVAGQSTGATRATIDPVGDEEVVNSMYLLFFEPSGNRSGAFEGAVKLDGPLLMNENIEVDMSGGILNPTGAYNVLAVANIVEYAPYLGISASEWIDQLEGKTENYAYSQLLAYTSADQPIGMDKIIMTGETSKAEGGLTTMELTLLRGVVRFDVVNSARTSYDLAKVSIWNAFPESSMFGGGLVDYSKTRIQRFYGVENDNDVATGNGIAAANDDPIDNTLPYYGDIFGGLYSFPNQVINPEEKDTKTTCLIVGLKVRGDDSAPITYHRININAEESMQNLKRNNVYRLTIRSVGGDGAGSEMEAYTGGKNNIDYQINYWDLDDDGMIQQNGNIILGIPTKRVKMGAEAEERSLDIFAFGGAQGEQIVVSTSFDGDAGNYIKVTQNGNRITINAQALLSDEERTGTINISYSGLTATIGVFQTGSASQFLRVTTPNGAGIPSFPGFKGAAMDGTVKVEASGPWTAKIYQLSSSNYFSFDVNTYKDTHNSATLTGNLGLYTFAENDGDGSRQAFVLISLDADADNYNSALVLTQRALGKIAVSPSITQVEWDGLGKLLTTGGSSDSEYKFQVITTQNDQSEYEAWTAALDDDTYFEIVTAKTSHSQTTLADNYVTVRAKGETTAGSQTATLRVQLASQSSTGVDIALKQTGYTMTVSPNTFSTVSNKGGDSGSITVSSNGTSLTWSAEVEKTEAASGTLTNHAAIIVDASGNALVQGTKYALSQPFKVKFPKLMYGNHKIGNVTATVKISMWSGANLVDTRTITVSQNALTPNDVSITNMYDYWGRITNDSNYGSAFRLMLANLFRSNGSEAPAQYPYNGTALSSIYAKSFSIPTSTSTSISSATYVHANCFAYLPSYYSSVESWRAGDNGVLVIINDPADATCFTNANSSLYKMGWSRNSNTYTSGARTPRPGAGKISDFIYNGPFGKVSSSVVVATGNTTSSAANITGQKAGGKTGKGVAIIGGDTQAGIVIDPANRVVYIGESEFFAAPGVPDGVNASLSNDRSRLLANIYAYIILTAQYESNFSDLFID